LFTPQELFSYNNSYGHAIKNYNAITDDVPLVFKALLRRYGFSFKANTWQILKQITAEIEQDHKDKIYAVISSEVKNADARTESKVIPMSQKIREDLGRSDLVTSLHRNRLATFMWIDIDDKPVYLVFVQTEPSLAKQIVSVKTYNGEVLAGPFTLTGINDREPGTLLADLLAASDAAMENKVIPMSQKIREDLGRSDLVINSALHELYAPMWIEIAGRTVALHPLYASMWIDIAGKPAYQLFVKTAPSLSVSVKTYNGSEVLAGPFTLTGFSVYDDAKEILSALLAVSEGSSSVLMTGFVLKEGMEVLLDENVPGKIIKVVLPRIGSMGFCDIKLNDGKVISGYSYDWVEEHLADASLKAAAQARHVKFSIDPRSAPDKTKTVIRAVYDQLHALRRLYADFMFFEISGEGWSNYDGVNHFGQYETLGHELKDIKGSEIITFEGMLRPDSKDRSQDNLLNGGIDLNARKMGLDVAKEGAGVEMKFDPAMVAEFQKGNFSGVEGIILKIIPIESPLPMLGM
jgi:hypothetical protein